MLQQRSQKFLVMSFGGLMTVGLLTSCDLLSALDVTASSSETVSYEQQVATHLRQTDAKMYGAYWCPYCTDQKALFGAAAAELPYVECDPQGENPQPDLCDAKQISVYPTWEINGELYTGVRSPLELAALSHYKAAPSPGSAPSTP